MLTAYDYRSVSPQDYELVRKFLAENGWAHRVADPEKFAKMMQRTDEAVVAWQGESIVGFGRALCDGVSNGYLSMVVVSEAARGQGVGREIVRRLIGNDPEITWVLRAGHSSEGFWSRMGFTASEVAMERTRQKMTLTLSSEIEKALTAAAVKVGRSPEELAEESLRAKFGVPVGFVGPRGLELRAQVNANTPAPEEATAEEKEQRRQEALALVKSGYFRDHLSSSDEFSARKAEEKVLEERRWSK